MTAAFCRRYSSGCFFIEHFKTTDGVTLYFGNPGRLSIQLWRATPAPCVSVSLACGALHRPDTGGTKKTPVMRHRDLIRILSRGFCPRRNNYDIFSVSAYTNNMITDRLIFFNRHFIQISLKMNVNIEQEKLTFFVKKMLIFAAFCGRMK